MARFLDRQKAIELRKQGKTYSEIKQMLGLSKSTLSDWLTSYPLSQNQLLLIKKNVRQNKDIAVEKYRNTMKLKREIRLKTTYDIQQSILLPLSKRELTIAGMFLYWGEGQKKINGAVAINNTDPNVVKFSFYWLTSILMVPRKRIKVYLHLYKDMDITEELQYWSNMLHVPKTQFAKPYIKKSTRSGLTHKGFGHGTCALVVGNVLLKEKIIMSIKAISDYYGEKI